MADPAAGPPTKTLIGPDGKPINYPDLPNVGESYQKPNQPHHDVPVHSSSSPSQHSETPPVTPTESWRERVIGAARSAVERVGLYGHAAAQALVLDDWKALADAHSSTLQRVEAGADLASWAIPEGKIAEIAGHAVAKASEIAAAHLTESGFEHAGVAAAAVAASRKNGLPLTEMERGGHFQSAEDFKRFNGPATKPGGPPCDWHHIVEKYHADKTKQFAPEQVHSVDNMVPIPRSVHQGAGGLTAAFSKNDEFIGTSLRQHLEGQPWEKHVDNGEQALRDRGLDPNALRAETRARFEERRVEHDRIHGISSERAATESSLDIANKPGRASVGRKASWLPGMSLDNFAESQAQSQGGATKSDNGLGQAYERNGVQTILPVGRHLEGTITSVDGDRIVQHIGRGQTATWSREELAAHLDDRKAFDAMMQPGNYIKVGVGSNGSVDVEQRLPDHSWQSLNTQPMPSAGHGHAR